MATLRIWGLVVGDGRDSQVSLGQALQDGDSFLIEGEGGSVSEHQRLELPVLCRSNPTTLP